MARVPLRGYVVDDRLLDLLKAGTGLHRHGPVGVIGNLFGFRFTLGKARQVLVHLHESAGDHHQRLLINGAVLQHRIEGFHLIGDDGLGALKSQQRQRAADLLERRQQCAKLIGGFVPGANE